MPAQFRRFLAVAVVIIVAAAVPAVAATGTTLRFFFPTPTSSAGRGMAFDGTHLYYTFHTDAGDRFIHKTDMFGNTVAAIPAPFIPGFGQPSAGPLAWDGTHLWTINYGSDGNLVRFTTAGDYVSHCNIFTTNPDHPLLNPHVKIDREDGLDWTGTHLVLSGEAFAGNSVVFLNTDCHITSGFTAPIVRSIGTSGVAFDGQYLWHPTDNNGAYVFQTTVDGVRTGRGFFTVGQGPEDLAYDPITFAPRCALWMNAANVQHPTGNFPTSRITAHEIPCGLGPNIDLTLAKSDSPDPVPTVENLTYTLTVRNNGPDAATSVMLTDTLPFGFNFISATPSQGTCSGSETVTCALGSLASGAEAEVVIVVRATQPGLYTNTATVQAAEGDLDESNNTATEETTVQERVLFDGSGQREDVNFFLAYASPLQTRTNLPAGTTSFDVIIRYGETIDPVTFNVTLNGAPVAGFTPVPGTYQEVTITLAPGRNVLALDVQGIRNDGRLATDQDRLVFLVP